MSIYRRRISKGRLTSRVESRNRAMQEILQGEEITTTTTTVAETTTTTTVAETTTTTTTVAETTTTTTSLSATMWYMTSNKSSAILAAAGAFGGAVGYTAESTWNTITHFYSNTELTGNLYDLTAGQWVGYNSTNTQPYYVVQISEDYGVVSAGTFALCSIANPTSISVNGGVVSGNIQVANQDDWYTFTTSDSGSYTMRTNGTTDLFMKLWNTDRTVMIAEDDDSGGSGQPLITQNLDSSTIYYIEVYYYNKNNTGSYTIQVTH